MDHAAEAVFDVSKEMDAADGDLHGRPDVEVKEEAALHAINEQRPLSMPKIAHFV